VIDREVDQGLTRDRSSDLRTVAKGGAVQIVGQVAQRSLSFLFGAIFTRLLGPGGYGLYRLVSQVLTNASQFGLAGFNYATMRFITRARAEGDAAGVKGAIRVGLVGVAIASAIVVAVVLVAADSVAAFFEDAPDRGDDLAMLLRIGVAYVPLYALLQVLRYATQAYKTMVPSVMAGNIVQPVVRFVLGVSLLIAGAGVAGAVVALNISVAVAAMVAGWYLVRILTSGEREARPKSRPGPMMRFAFPQAGASLLGVQTLGLGILILGYYSSDVAVGLFAIALSLQGPGNVFLGGIVNIWAPVVSDLHAQGEIGRLGSLYQTINRWIATFSFPVFAALIIMPHVFVGLFAGPKGAGAAPIVAILAIGNLFYTGTGPTGYVISMTGRPGVNFVNSIVSVVLYIALGAVVVPEHGAIGMAAVDAFVTALVNIVRVIEAKVLVGIHPFGRTFYKPVVATLAGAAVLVAWRLLPPTALVFDAAGIAVGAVAYAVALKALGVDEEERYVFDRIRKRAGRRRRGGGAE